VHHQGGGGDNLSVTFKLLSDADPVNPDTTAGTPGEATKLTGSVISFNTTPITSLTITQQPTNRTVTEGFIGTFSVAVQTDSEITPKYQWKRNGTPIAGATSSTYSPTVTAADNGAKYSVTVSVPGFATSVTSSDATLTVRSPVFTPGFLKYELWLNKVRTDVESGNAGAPTVVGAMPSMQTTNNAGDPHDYADRLSGFFIPSTNGNYVFFLGSDDDGDLYLSTDDTAANKKLIAQEAGYSGFDSWNTIGGTSTSADKRSDQFANSAWPTPNVITLTAGKRYYIEADHHEGGGGDWLGAYVKLDTEDDPVDGTPSNLTGSRIGFFVAPATVTIAKQPTNVAGTEGFGATFTANGTSDSQVNIISYQWQKNGVDIPAATSASYTTPPLAEGDNTNKYRVVINAPGATAVTSAEVSSTVGAPVFGTGILKHEVWNGVSDRTQAEADTLGVPNLVETLSNFQTPFNAGDPPNTYTDRISGFFIPDATGDYVFFVGSDDQSDLYLSTDENPANRKLIAQESIWSNSAQWLTSGGGSSLPDKRSDTFSASEWPTPNVITLTNGVHYYIEVDHQEGTGGDWVGVYAKLSTAADPVDGTPSNLTGTRIAAFGPPQTTSTAPRFTSTTAANGNVIISWTGTGTLQQATQLTGNASDWSDVTPAPTSTSYTVNGASGNRFFRLKQ
jgi:hypothetical protein